MREKLRELTASREGQREQRATVAAQNSYNDVLRHSRGAAAAVDGSEEAEQHSEAGAGGGDASTSAGETVITVSCTSSTIALTLRT